MNNEQIVNAIMKTTKQFLMQALTTESNPVEAMKKTAKGLVDIGFPVERSVVTVKALMIQISNELDIPHPFTETEIKQMMEIVK
ncbi:MAG: hypothetical protein [Caudoviricetes sp.]|nr:MAG: hypothetical protein [Caudoviricetes sp.]